MSNYTYVCLPYHSTFHDRNTHSPLVLMPRFIAWGCNVTGALDPTSKDQVIQKPRDVSEALECDEIIWTGWAGTAGRSKSRYGRADAAAKGVQQWGLSNADIRDCNVKRILGFDSIVAYFDGEYVRDFGGRESSKLDDASISGTGAVYTFKRG
jgi:hypothetical protein